MREAPNRVLYNIVGGVISPLLANIVLHYVLDEWFAKEVRPRLKGEAFLIRYADDFVIGVAREDDARRIMEVLPKRMSKYGLTVHPEKTRVVRFHPADVADSEPADQNSTGPRTFDFLGFTHYWGRSLKGGWVVKRKTAKSRLKRAIHSLSDWCRQHLHQPIAVQHQTLKQKLQGHYAYYGITGNFPSLQEFLEEARTDLATLALAAPPRWRDPLVGLPSTGATLRLTQTASGPQPVAQRSEVISEEPGARDVQARI